jgi:hypothetical protein
MIIEGVLWRPADCSRFATPLRRLIESRARLDRTQLDPRLVQLLNEMESVARSHRDRVEAQAEAAEASSDSVDAETLRGREQSSAPLWNVRKAADHLGIKPAAVTSRCRRGTIPARKCRGRWLIDPEALAA